MMPPKMLLIDRFNRRQHICDMRVEGITILCGPDRPLHQQEPSESRLGYWTGFSTVLSLLMVVKRIGQACHGAPSPCGFQGPSNTSIIIVKRLCFRGKKVYYWRTYDKAVDVVEGAAGSRTRATRQPLPAQRVVVCRVLQRHQ